MSNAEIQLASKMLSPAGRDAQAILDVLQAAVTAGEIRKSRLAYLKALVARYRKGEFDPTPGLAVAEERKRKQRRPRFMQKPTTEAVLREHARLLRKDEDGYLEECQAGMRRSRSMSRLVKGELVFQGGLS